MQRHCGSEVAPKVPAWMPTFVGMTLVMSSLAVRDEFQQRAIGIAEVDAEAGAARGRTLDRPQLDGHAQRIEVRLGFRDRAGPLEAQVAVARLNRHARHRRRTQAGSMTVELH